ncbi:MAG: hypothetical protein AABY16_03425 [Nanoarchaeota archaeon]
MSKRGQISLEYLIVVAFVVFAVIVILGVSLFYTSSAQDQIKLNQLFTFATKITTSAESVYYAGEPSKVTITAFLPDGVQNIEVISNNIVFTIVTSSGTSVIAFESNVPLDSATTILTNEGLKRIVIRAGADRVYVTEA